MVYRYIFIVAHHLWPLCFSCNAFAKFSTASPWNKSWGPPWCFAVHPCHHQQPDLTENMFYASDHQTLTNQQIKKNGTAGCLVECMSSLRDFPAEWKNPRPSNPNATLKLRKQVHSSGFFRLAEEPKHRRLRHPNAWMTKHLPLLNTLIHRILNTCIDLNTLYLQLFTVLYQYFLYLFM